MADFKKKNDYITLIDGSFSSLKDLILKVSGKDNFISILDFSNENYKLSVKDISSKFQCFHILWINLSPNYSTVSVQTYSTERSILNQLIRINGFYKPLLKK